jgi:hypothetical protein
VLRRRRRWKIDPLAVAADLHKDDMRWVLCVEFIQVPENYCVVCFLGCHGRAVLTHDLLDGFDNGHSSSPVAIRPQEFLLWARRTA